MQPPTAVLAGEASWLLLCCRAHARPAQPPALGQILFIVWAAGAGTRFKFAQYPLTCPCESSAPIRRFIALC
ncbi:hypothetical protein F5Y10DRAFT_183536 [Nemania abortiva]|nr:hypothetical protein F5Y10DRAFT_183536 [Nemania abortiva]